MEILKYFFTSSFLMDQKFVNKTECSKYCGGNKAFIASFRDIDSFEFLFQNLTFTNDSFRVPGKMITRENYQFHADIVSVKLDYDF